MSKRFSDRQLAIMQGLANGKRQGDIAAELGIAQQTLKNELQNAKHALLAENTWHAIVVAVREGIIS